MKLIQTLKGGGVGSSRTGHCAVDFCLLIYRDDDGSTQIRGWVLPLFGVKGELLTLQMSEGGMITFSFMDVVGSIISHGGISKT
jgi:hypothetical protein